MITENHIKNYKFKFDVANFDFSWEISPEDSTNIGDGDYRSLLRNTYNYNPAMHEFDTDRFKVSNK